MFGWVAGAQTAQDRTVFEAASVKPAAPRPTGLAMLSEKKGGPGTPSPGQVNFTNMPLRDLVLDAYGMKAFQLQAPRWLEEQRYDVSAKLAPGTTREQYRTMLQQLLTERFQIASHAETREMAAYALTVPKGGPKLRVSTTDEGAAAAEDTVSALRLDARGFPRLAPGVTEGTRMIMLNGRVKMTFGHQPVSSLLEVLTSACGRPVFDQTGLTTKYDFTLEFTPDSVRAAGGPPPAEGVPAAALAEDSGPTVYSAVLDQLGLKLEARKMPVEVLIIDRIEKAPTGN